MTGSLSARDHCTICIKHVPCKACIYQACAVRRFSIHFALNVYSAKVHHLHHTRTVQSILCAKIHHSFCVKCVLCEGSPLHQTRTVQSMLISSIRCAKIHHSFCIKHVLCEKVHHKHQTCTMRRITMHDHLTCTIQRFTLRIKYVLCEG